MGCHRRSGGGTGAIPPACGPLPCSGGADPNRCSHAARCGSLWRGPGRGRRARAARRPDRRRPRRRPTSSRASRPTAPSSSQPPEQVVAHVRRADRRGRPALGGVQRRPVRRTGHEPARVGDDGLTLTRRHPPADASRHVQRGVERDAGRGRAPVPTATSRSPCSTRRPPSRARRPPSRLDAAADDHGSAEDGETASERAERRSTPSEVSDGATWLGRVLSTLGLAVLFGSLVADRRRLAGGPGVHPRRALPALGLAAHARRHACSTSSPSARRSTSESLGNGLNPAAGSTCSTPGGPGRAAFARLVLVVACGWVVLRPERVIDPTTQLPAIALPTLAVVTLGLSRTGGDLAILGVVAGIAHALAMAIWVGGVVLLARVVLAGPGEEDLVHAVRGFNRSPDRRSWSPSSAAWSSCTASTAARCSASRHGRVLLAQDGARGGRCCSSG